MGDRQLESRLLLQAGRLLLEYNESTGEIHRTLQATAKSLSAGDCQIAISYGGIAVTLAGDSPAMQSVKALRYNSAVQAQIHGILQQVRGGKLAAPAGLARLATVEARTPKHAGWLVALLLGAAAASLAGLLGADVGAAAIAGAATGLGLLARHRLGRWPVSPLALPLAAAFIGGFLGAMAIRLGWTRTPELALIVPGLMLVPGPHLINALLDLFDNYLPMSLARFGLATGILLASAAGIVLGIEAAQLPLHTAAPPAPGGTPPGPANLAVDVVLAGFATCGFAIFYNTAWRHVWLAALPGMGGHGLRCLTLEAGCPLLTATFAGGLAVGLLSAWMARSRGLPVAVVAFAGAVTMIPGLQLYRALGGAILLSRLGANPDPAIVAGALGNALQASIVVSGLAVGLILGVHVVMALSGEGARPEEQAR
jgi:uncharacterized membrane protein YjjP (DUF1212 family)